MPHEENTQMVLKLNSVSKSYIPGKNVLNAVSFRIDRGEVMVLCGESGSGKTTLVRIIAGLLDFDSGELCLGENSVIRAGKRYHSELFGKIGVVFQQHNLFPHMTAKRNISIALNLVKKKTNAEADAAAMALLSRVGLTDKADAYPHTLSGGERQRVSIARALAVEPHFILLDEPTAHLDPQLVDDVLTLVDDLSKGGTTMLLITHNLRFAKHVGQRFCLLKNGALTVSDSPDILKSMEGRWS